MTGAPGLGECVPAARPERGWQDRRHRPEQGTDPRRPVRSARRGPGPRRVYRRRIHRQGPRGQAWPTGGYHVAPGAARTIAALLALRDHVIAPILAGVRSPRMGRKPKNWTAVDRDYEALRIDMQTLFTHVGIAALPAAA